MLRRLPRFAVLGGLIGLMIGAALSAYVAMGVEGAEFLRAYFGFGLSFPAMLVTFPLLWLPHGDALFPLITLPLNGVLVGWLATRCFRRSTTGNARSVPPAA
jgi:hypothetical protein